MKEGYPLTNWLLALAICLFLVDVALRRFQYVPKQIRLIANLRQKSVQKSDKNSVSSAQNIGSTQVFQTPERGRLCRTVNCRLESQQKLARDIKSSKIRGDIGYFAVAEEKR